MTRLTAFCLCLGLVVSSAGQTTNMTYYVDQKHPEASDANAGTHEAAPLETIQRAMDSAASGGTVWVKSGVYREQITIRISGQYRGRTRGYGEPIGDGIVLAAYANDKVVIDGTEVVASNRWQPATWRKGVYVAEMTGEPAPGLVFWNGQRLDMCREKARNRWRAALPGTDDAGTWGYDRKRRELYVHLGGADPRREGVLEAAVRPTGIELNGRQFLTLSKLIVRGATEWGIQGRGAVEPTVRDCEVRDCGGGICLSGALRPWVVRCVVHDVAGCGVDVAGGRGAVLYDNVVYAFGPDGERISDRAAGFRLEGVAYARCFQNLAVQQPADATEPRGCGFLNGGHCPGQIWAGNAARGCAAGFAVGPAAVNNLVFLNTALKSGVGVAVRGSAGITVAENYCVSNGVALALVDAARRVPEVANTVFSHNWLSGNATGVWAEADGGGREQNKNYAQRNVYDVSPGQTPANWAGMSHPTLDAFRQTTRQETFGRQAAVSADEIGLVWARLDGLPAPNEPIPLIGSPDCERQNFLLDNITYFWRRGDALGTDGYPYGLVDLGGRADYPYWHLGCWPGGPVSSGRSWGGAVAWLTQPPVTNTPVGGGYLFAGSLVNATFTTNGLGWWSPSLPCGGGDTADVSLWMMVSNVTATAANGGIVVYVEWSDWNGQNKRRSYVVGGEGGSVQHPDLNQGTAGWREVRASVTAPSHARRFALFMGGRDCSGAMAFDAIRTLAVRGAQNRENGQ